MSSETKRVTFRKLCSFYCNSRKRKYFAVRKIRGILFFSGGLYQISCSLPVLYPQMFSAIQSARRRTKVYSSSSPLRLGSLCELHAEILKLSIVRATCSLFLEAKRRLHGGKSVLQLALLNFCIVPSSYNTIIILNS